jgi:helix-turn-helix protein/GAF domain-containing protein
MAESFGERLRQRREQRQIPLSTIADQTKIGLTLLEGLERGDVSRWPSGIFRRAFMKSYAAAIGLEPDAVVREFLEVHPDPAELAAVPCQGVAVPIAANGTAPPPSRMRMLVGSALGSLFHDEPTPSIAPTPQPSPREVPREVPREPRVEAPARWHPDVSAAAAACTELSQVGDVGELPPLLASVVHVLGATGLIIWTWDQRDDRLRPALAHGYGAKVLAHVPPLRSDEKNATATAFRTAQPSIVPGSDATSGALAVPVMGPVGCVGVLAIEFHDGREKNEMVRTLATMFAALIGLLVWDGRCAARLTDARVQRAIG